MTRALVAIVATLSLACAAASAQDQDPIKIGGVAPLSPPGGVQTGESLRNGMRIAAEEINAGGGVLGRQVELLVEDSSGVPEQGVAAMRRLIESEGVVATTGSAHSAVCAAVGPVAQETNTAFIAGECWADTVTAAQIPEVFRITVANSLVYSIAADWVKEVGFDHVAIIAENSDWGFGIIDVFRENLEESGTKVTSFTAERTVSDFTPQILQLMRAEPRPDLLVAGFTGSGLLSMLRQSFDQGFAPSLETAVFAAGADVLEPEFWDVMGEDGVYTIGNPAGLPGVPDTEMAQNFQMAYQEAYGRPANAVAMEGYDGVMLIAEAIRMAGSADREAIQEALREIRWDGTRGAVFFPQTTDPEWRFQQLPEVPVFVIQYTEAGQSPSEAAILWPRDYGTTEELILRPE